MPIESRPQLANRFVRRRITFGDFIHDRIPETNAGQVVAVIERRAHRSHRYGQRHFGDVVAMIAVDEVGHGERCRCRIGLHDDGSVVLCEYENDGAYSRNRVNCETAHTLSKYRYNQNAQYTETSHRLCGNRFEACNTFGYIYLAVQFDGRSSISHHFDD